MITIKQLVKKYPKQKQATLNQVSACFEKGKISVILGASGNGKTTLLHCILQLETPDAGSIQLDTHNQFGHTQSIPMTGVLQNPALFQHLTVMENLTMAPRNVLKKSAETAGLEAMDMLIALDLEDKAHKYPNELSGGECQRISIARSLMMNPEILVLDEPTNALNEEWMIELVALLRAYAHQGMTIIISTHNLMFAHQIADALFVLEDGRMSPHPHHMLAQKIHNTHKLVKKPIPLKKKERAVIC